MNIAIALLLTTYLLINLWILIPTLIHCNNHEEHNAKRLIWVFALIVFSLPCVILYWFIQSKKHMTHSFSGTQYFENKHLIFVILVFIYEVFSLILFVSYSHSMLILLCLIIMLLLAFVNHFLDVGNKSPFLLVLPFIQVISIISVNLMAASDEFKIIILIVVVSILNEFPINFSRRFSIVPLILYMSLSTFVFLIDEKSIGYILVYITRNSITYSLVVGAFYFSRKYLLLNQELHHINLELRENNRQLEEIGIVKERNRIAREIHDTLGHTLTGAIIQLEAAKKLIHIDQAKALVAVEKTQEITREGFLDVKRAIQALRPILIEEGNLKDSLEALFEKIQHDFNIEIHHSIHIDNVSMESLKVSLYRIIQESITNSIRHGNATKIVICLEQRKNALELMMSDNGKGCQAIQENYGLKGIRERVSSFNGHIRILSNLNEGFQLLITLPIY